MHVQSQECMHTLLNCIHKALKIAESVGQRNAV